MTPISVDGETKAQKGQISQPAKTIWHHSGPSGTRVISYCSQHPLSGVGTLWAQEGGGPFWKHRWPCPLQGGCLWEGGWPLHPELLHTPSPYSRHFWNLPARPQHVPATSCQSGHLQGKDVRAGRPEGRGRPAFTPLFPFQPRSTICLASQHPPSVQAHQLSGKPPGPPHQSHTPLSQALPIAPATSRLRQPLLPASGRSRSPRPSTD